MKKTKKIGPLTIKRVTIKQLGEKVDGGHLIRGGSYAADCSGSCSSCAENCPGWYSNVMFDCL